MKNSVREQFLAAYDNYAEAIYRHCFFRVYSKGLAEELTQETFLKTWQYLAKGKEVDNLRAFLYRVANNLIIDNSRKKREERLDDLMEVSSDIEPSHDSRDEIEAAEMAREVISKMDGLREEDREILKMRYLEQLELKEIAEALDITINNVSVRLNRAMKALKHEISK